MRRIDIWEWIYYIIKVKYHCVFWHWKYWIPSSFISFKIFRISYMTFIHKITKKGNNMWLRIFYCSWESLFQVPESTIKVLEQNWDQHRWNWIIPIAIPSRYPWAKIILILFPEYLRICDEKDLDTFGTLAHGPLEFLNFVYKKFIVKYCHKNDESNGYYSMFQPVWYNLLTFFTVILFFYNILH